MSSGKERTADLILAAAAAAAAAASFLPASFASGLLFHSALAAAAGGAADWFAVNSLFRKPLGFSFRTELVPKSRDKIIRMARDMLEREILTAPRIYKVFKNHSISLALIDWAAENRDILREAAEQAAGVCLRALDKKAAAELGAEAAEKIIRDTDWAELLSRALEGARSVEGSKALFHAFRRCARIFLQDGFTDEELLTVYNRAWTLYEGESMRRGMLRGLLQSQLGLTDDKACALMQEKLMEWADSLGDPEGAAGRQMAEQWENWLRRLKTDQALRERINRAVSGKLSEYLHTAGADTLEKLLEEKERAAGKAAADYLLCALEKAADDENFRRKADRWILRQIANYLPVIHRKLGESAESALSRYSGKEMADLIENSVWHDLQMIRINGSLIGAFLGGLSYIAFYWISGGAPL